MRKRRMVCSSGTSYGTTMATTTVLMCLLLATIVPYEATIALPEGTFPVAKRMNIETCLVRFDVHLNTIIRTEESRSMGACFLDDADVNTREQCLRLCCETENCDVFVFEEKSPGTCFLFQCGPPENFRCKFTHHSNYTSAVLSMPSMEQTAPQAPPLTTQIQSLSAQQQQQTSGKKHLSQHEMELVSLKEIGGSSAGNVQSGNFGPTTTTSLPPLGVRLGETPSTPGVVGTPAKQPLSMQQQCGHFEFPCHSGECIAVYNVCDGIPQCEDGSDEGPDCPQKSSGPATSAGSLNAPIAVMPAGQPNHIGLVGNNKSPMGVGEMGGSKMMPMYQPLEYQQTPNRFNLDATQQQQLQQQPQLQPKQLLPGKPIMMHRNREDPMTAPKPWPRPGFNELNYVDTSDSHIFNHKGGLQLSSSVNNMVPPAAQQYQDTLPESSYLSSSVVRGVGGQSYLSLPAGSSYPQQIPQQMPPDAHQPQYQAAISSQQWMDGNPMHPNWQLNPASNHRGIPAEPLEQYIQPPVQQRRVPAPAAPQPPVNVALQGATATAQQNPSLVQKDPSAGQQWSVEGQTQPELVQVPVAPTAGSPTRDKPSTAADSLSKDAVSKEVADQSQAPGAGESQNRPKHNKAAGADSASVTHDGDTAYEEDAYEDSYPDSTNAGTAVEAEQPTQTEPPKKKLRKHHKHDHGDTDPSTNNEQTQEEKQKKKKKPKTTKKDKAVHEHLKAPLPKDLEIEFTDHDGYADRPGGAMLSLTLGVLLTAAMGILLSCRMRVARRRIRRPGKSSYAHDADFLVNGMYL